MWASSGRAGDTNPTRKPASASSRSAAKLVSVKWSKNSLGSIWAMGRPPHHSAITAITRAWSDGRSGRIIASPVTGWPGSRIGISPLLRYLIVVAAGQPRPPGLRAELAGDRQGDHAAPVPSGGLQPLGRELGERQHLGARELGHGQTRPRLDRRGTTSRPRHPVPPVTRTHITTSLGPNGPGER